MKPGEVVNKEKFDGVLRRLIATDPVPFKEVVAEPKPKKGGGFKRSAKRKKG